LSASPEILAARRARAADIRRNALRMVHHADASHIGSSLSIADILAHLYGGVLRVDPSAPEDPQRDRLIVSKGHAAAGVYSALAGAGFFPLEWLARYCDDGFVLAGHVTRKGVPGVELSTGSLGHGLPVAVGMAFALRDRKSAPRVFALLSDGECDEGTTWESALIAARYALDNLVLIIDYNKIQSLGRVEDVLPLEPLADKWRAFGWAVREAQGHDHADLAAAFEALPYGAGKPSLLIAHTVKGKGVDYMENTVRWHYKSPNDEQLAEALRQIDSAEEDAR